MLEWLRRPPKAETRRARLGLALGGGAVRGAAHVGVLSVLEREGIRPDVVAGVSVGAFVGAGIAAGVPAADILEAFRHSSWLRIAVPSWRSPLGMLDSSPLGVLIEKLTRSTECDKLELPFAAVACDLLTGERVVLDAGPLHEAICASSAVPGIFEPVRRDGALLVDGGLVGNVPVEVARDLGADYVIGIDIMPLAVDSAEPRELRDVILMSWEIVQHQCDHGRLNADLLLTPDVGPVIPWDFSHAGDAYDAGVAAMEAALPKLREDLARGVTPPPANRT